jgi:hypothetical protein
LEFTSVFRAVDFETRPGVPVAAIGKRLSRDLIEIRHRVRFPSPVPVGSVFGDTLRWPM